jgi:hypothetical protein
MKHLFTEVDPTTGLKSEYLTDGKVLMERTSADRQATTDTLDHLARLSTDENYSSDGIKQDWWHVGSIPAEVWLHWKNEGFDIFTASTEEILKKLRHPDYARLRATSGRI